MPVLEKSFYGRLPQIGRGRPARLEIGLEIARGGHIRFDSDQPFEPIRERYTEKTDARKQIERHPPPSFPDDGANQFIQQNPVHLKKRQMADSIAMVSYSIADVAWPGEVKLIGAAIVSQKRFHRRQRRTK